MSESPASEAIRHIFPPRDKVPGCDFCGAKDMKYSSTGQEFWHPARNCCLPNTILQMLWRQTEIRDITRSIDHLRREHDRKQSSKGTNEAFTAPSQLRIKLEGDPRDPEYLSINAELEELTTLAKRHPATIRREALEQVRESDAGREYSHALNAIAHLLLR